MVSLSAITGTAEAVYKYGKRFLKTTPELVLGTGNDVVAEALRGTKGSIFHKAEAGWQALEKMSNENIAKEGNFFKRLWKQAMDFGPSVKNAAVDSYKAAEKAGENALWGGVKGVFKGLGKNMPFIGAALTLLFEIPNAWTATKEQGLFQGAAEVLKSGSGLIGGGVGAAIGQALIPIPFVGAMAGWILGEHLVRCVVGESYTEKKMKQETEALAQTNNNIDQLMQYMGQQGTQFNAQNQNNNVTAQAVNPYNMYNPYNQFNPYNQLYNNDYSKYANDMMMQGLNFNQLM